MARSSITEMGVFGIGLGLMVGAAAYYTLSSTAMQPELWGMKRQHAIGFSLASLALANVGSALALFFTRSSVSVTFCLISGAAVSGFYFSLMMSAGTLGLNLVTIIMAVMPFMLLSASRKAQAELDGVPPQ